MNLFDASKQEIVLKNLTLSSAVLAEPGRLVPGFVHDLKAPISTIVSSAELLEEELDASMSHHLVSVIQRQTDRLHGLVQDLTDYFGVGVEKTLIHPGTIDLTETIRQICNDFQAANASHKLDVRLPAAQILIQADYSKVRRILENLLFNAFKYSAPQSTVLTNLRSQTEDRYGAIIEVEDEGPGIPEKDRTRIFEPFVRLAPAACKGQGLGLNIVKQLAEAHGGRSWVEPRSPRGSRFCVALPARHAT